MVTAQGVRSCVRAIGASLLLLVCPLFEQGARGADTWPAIQSGDPTTLLVEIPAGALPPGPAELSAEPGGDRHVRSTLRFEMPREAVRLRLLVWRIDSFGAGPVKVLARSDSGAIWHGAIDPNSLDNGAGSASPIFVGDGLTLSEFTKQIRSYARIPSQVASVTENIRVLSFDRVQQMGCRSMAATPLVIATAGQGDALRACASRGAHVLLVGADLAGPVAELAPGEAHTWGGGTVAWSPSVDELAARGALDLQAWSTSGYYRTPLQDFSDDEERTTPGRGSIMLVLVLYVSLLGPIGYLVNRRPRTPALAWGWFPAVAIVGTFVLVGAAGASGAAPPMLAVRQTSFTSPDGIGLERADCAIHANPGVYRLAVPWHDADGAISEAYRFGSPFGRPAGRVDLHEDAMRGVLQVDGLGVSRLGRASVQRVRAFQAPVPLLRWRDGSLWLENPTPSVIEHAELLIEDRFAEFDELEPGGSRRVALTSLPATEASSTTTPQENRRIELREIGGRHTKRGHAYFLAAEMKEDAPQLTIDPSLPVVLHSTRTVVGPIPGPPPAARIHPGAELPHD